MLVPSPYPSPANQVIPDLDYPLEHLPITRSSIDHGSPGQGIVPSPNHSEHNSDDWILGPWPSSRPQSNHGDYHSSSMPHPESRPGHHRSQSANHMYHGGAANPFNYPQPAPNTGWMGNVSLPGQPSPRAAPGYVPAYPPMGSPYPQNGMLSPYQGHQQQQQQQQQPPPGWGGALVPAGAVVPYQPQQQLRLPRPKEEEIVAIDRWQPGNDYGVVLDSLKFNILKPPVVAHALLGPTPSEHNHPTLVYNLLFEPNRIHLSNESPQRAWRNGRNDPATFPRLTHISLISPHFPWIVEVRNDAGVTCDDVVQKLYHFMQARIDKSEWEALPQEERRAIGASYKWNRSTNPGAPGGYMSDGLARVDFLGKRTLFSGLVRDDVFVQERLSTTTGAVFVLLLSER